MKSFAQRLRCGTPGPKNFMSNTDLSSLPATSAEASQGASPGVPTGEMVRLLETMKRESDIKTVVRLVPSGAGRYRYLIETSFATFPKFVVGTTDASFDDVRIESRCGLFSTADEAWARKPNVSGQPRAEDRL